MGQKIFFGRMHETEWQNPKNGMRYAKPKGHALTSNSDLVAHSPSATVKSRGLIPIDESVGAGDLLVDGFVDQRLFRQTNGFTDLRSVPSAMSSRIPSTNWRPRVCQCRVAAQPSLV